MTPPTQKLGRPPVTTAHTLRDAAFELFQVNGYDQTSVTDIARVAGVSRGTYFNYFDSKSDVFWLEVDQLLRELPAALRRVDPHLPPLPALAEALGEVFSSWHSGAVPWVLTQFELIGSPAAVLESAGARVLRAHHIIAEFAAARFAALAANGVSGAGAANETGSTNGTGARNAAPAETAESDGHAPRVSAGDLLWARALSGAVVGAAVTGIHTWAKQGPGRGHVRDVLRDALTPLACGFDLE